MAVNWRLRPSSLGSQHWVISHPWRLAGAVSAKIWGGGLGLWFRPRAARFVVHRVLAGGGGGGGGGRQRRRDCAVRIKRASLESSHFLRPIFAPPPPPLFFFFFLFLFVLIKTAPLQSYWRRPWETRCWRGWGRGGMMYVPCGKMVLRNKVAKGRKLGDGVWGWSDKFAVTMPERVGRRENIGLNRMALQKKKKRER